VNDVIIINREGKSKIILNGTPLEGVKEFELKQIGQTGELTLTISIGNLEKKKAETGSPLLDLSNEKPRGNIWLDEKKAIRENLQYYMKLHNFNQKELAEALDIDPSAVSSWVHGKTVPRPSLLEKIADLFSINVQEIKKLKAPVTTPMM